MKKQTLLLCVALIFMGFLKSNAQTGSNQVYEYYVSIVGVTTKSDVKSIESRLAQQAGITLVAAFKFPVKYFVLKTTRPVTQAEVTNWLSFGNYTIKSFGQGEKAREEATLMTRKFN